jgi:probable rRNA maturation factor
VGAAKRGAAGSGPGARAAVDRRSAIYARPWRIDLTVMAGVPRLVPVAALARLLARALARAGAPAPASIGLVLAHDRKLARLNREAMGKRGATDVLSFPLLPPAAFPSHGGAMASAGPPGARAGGGLPPAASFVLPPGARPHLGDIVVSVERAAAQARSGRGGQTSRSRWEPADEMRLLVVHGALHLCGWDHAAPEEAAAMRALERELLGADGRTPCPA